MLYPISLFKGDGIDSISMQLALDILAGGPRSVKEECLSKLILFGEHSLRRAVSNFLAHFHHERNHQGKDNLLLFPTSVAASATQPSIIRCRERLGGLLKSYYSTAA
jgi:hypothetical protein